MNILLFTSGDIETICSHITWVVGIIAGCYLVQLLLKWLLRPREVKVIEEKQNEEEKKLEYELKRQDRVRGLMKEICELTNKGNDGQYNDTEARNLFTLYQDIDKQIKLQYNTDNKGKKNGQEK